jgi:phage gpG-like protein
MTDLQEGTSGTEFKLSANPDQKTFNTFTREMKTELSKAYIKASTQIKSEVGDLLLDNMESPIWAWPRPTRRVSGGTVNSPRDIVDTQELQDRNSVKVSFNIKGFTMSIRNSAPYSGIVHYGGYVGGGGRGTYIPGRPFISLTLGIKPQGGAGSLSIPGSGVTVVDYKGILEAEVAAAIARAAATSAKGS